MAAHSLTIGSGDAPATVLLIHGYTGTPHDFNGLPEYLHEHMGVRVVVPLLPGHDGPIEKLDAVSYEDFVQAAEAALLHELEQGRTVMLGGMSFGALLALRLAARYPVLGVINVGAPFRFRFPFSVPGVGLLRFFKKYWPKHFLDEELLLRQSYFFHDTMHINGLSMVHRARRDVQMLAPALSCPVLTIHATSDPIGSVYGAQILHHLVARSGEFVTYTAQNHNMFFSAEREDAYYRIGQFLQALLSEVPVADNPGRQRVAAIVPAYDEGARIRTVLETLIATPEVDEIIVVDDGSHDGTATVANIPGVRVVRNDYNLGKAQSIECGIKETSAPILFFCDADLTELTPAIVSQIVTPVLRGDRDMFIGVRDNLSQKALTLFALNSGERALRREVWEALPDFFKTRYRLEVGLNVVAYLRENGYGWRHFSYYQTLKEVKYGVLRGSVLRWWMNWDVVRAYAYALWMLIMNRFRRHG